MKRACALAVMLCGLLCAEAVEAQHVWERATIVVMFDHPTTPNGEALTVASGDLDVVVWIPSGPTFYEYTTTPIYTDQHMAIVEVYFMPWHAQGYSFLVSAHFGPEFVDGPFGTRWAISGSGETDWMSWPEHVTEVSTWVDLPLTAQRQ